MNQELIINNHNWTAPYNLEANFRYIISQQESYGWKMDINAMNQLKEELQTKLDKLEQHIKTTAPKKVTNEKELKKPLKKDGSHNASVQNWYNNLDIRMFPLSAVWGGFTRIRIEEINVESPKQRIEALQKVGWIPTEYNYKVDKYKKPIYEDGNKVPLSPKLTADSVVNVPLGQDMVKYVQMSHRLKLVKGLGSRVREDGAIGGGGNTVGCNTGRMMHRNIVNIPRAGEFYGSEIRSLFSHREGCILVGADLSALENRLMGHYTYNIDGGVYAKRIMKEDPHDRTAEVLKVTRGQAKTINYAMSFGCSFHKLKDLLSCTDSEAKAKHKAWWNDKEPLLKLKKKLEEAVSTRNPMWIKGLDGRKVYCRSKHSLLNALIQSAGSIVNKFITCEVYKQMNEQSIDGHLVLNYHDEIDLEVKNNKETLDKMNQIIDNSVEKCNKHFNFKVPMAMDVKVGSNWASIH